MDDDDSKHEASLIGDHDGSNWPSRTIVSPATGTRREFRAARALFHSAPAAHYFSECFTEHVLARAIQHHAPAQLQPRIKVTIEPYHLQKFGVDMATYNPVTKEIDRKNGWADSIERAVSLLNTELAATVNYRAGVEALKKQHKILNAGHERR